MKQIRILGTAFVAVFALAAVASSSASAEALPNLLPCGTSTTHLTGNSSTGASVFGTGVFSLSSSSASGTFTGESCKLGKYKETYIAVRGPLGESCLGLGQVKGTVVSEGEYHVRDYKAGSLLATALAFLVKELHIECGTTLIVVKGCVAASVSPENKLTKEITITLKEGSKTGDNEIIKIENEAGTGEENCELLSSQNGAAFTLSAQTQTTKLSGFKLGTATTEVLVMKTP